MLYIILAIVVLFLSAENASAEDAILFQTISDSLAVQDDPAAPAEVCLHGKAYAMEDEGDGDYLKIVPNKWHSGTILFGKKKTGYYCKLGDGSRPNLGLYTHLIFQAKAHNFNPSLDCNPKLDFYGGSWPRKSSNQIILSGEYVLDADELVDYEYRTVVIPTSDLKTSDFPLDQIQKLTFRNCGGMSGQRYDLQGIRMTDNPPTGGGGGGGVETSAPTESSTTLSPTLRATTLTPTLKPSTLAPQTSQPSKVPTDVPTIGVLEDLVVYDSLSDGYSVESSDQSCLYNNHKGISTQATDPQDGDYMIIEPDPWRPGGISFGCLAKTDGVCTHTCFQDGSYPDFSPYSALAFLAKLDNGEALVDECKPTLLLYGGGSGSSIKESNRIILQGTYVDEGSLVADEYRQVVIPTQDLQTNWDLSGVKQLRFLSCGTEVPSQPLIKVKNVRLTIDPPSVRSMSPTTAPTERVTDDQSLATHFYYHNGWYPLVNKSVGTWLYATNNAWPDVPDNSPDGEYSIVIPSGSSVVYSGSTTSAKLNQVVVDAGGSLEISASDDVQTSLTLGTLRVEEGGILNIITDASSSTIDIQFHGDIDHDADPTEMLNGLVSFGGTVLIEGREKCSKMEKIVQAFASSSTVSLAGSGAADCWSVGDDIVLSDTQVGLDSGHYDFIPSVYNTTTDSQLEIASIVSLEVVDNTTVITLDHALAFEHLAGSHVAMVSRSITLRTSPSSAVRGHILHTGYGSFDVKNTRVEDMGRAGVEPFNNTVLEVDTSVDVGDGLAKMTVVSRGTNQIARYALHAHHSLVPMIFSGNVILGGKRFGIVAHNSRVSILNNVVVAVEGTGILLEDGTETGDVKNNYIVGDGSGSGESDSQRFTPSQGTEFAHGGFGIWSRTCYSSIEDNVAEGVFGESPYAFFLHINFMEDRIVPNVTGTPTELIGKTRGEVRYDVNNNVLSLNTYGSFKGHSCLGTYKRAFGANYFLMNPPYPQGHLLEDFNVVSLGKSGAGFSFGHSSRFTITGSLDAIADENTIVGVAVSNGNLTVHDCDYSYNNIEVLRSGCMECFTEQDNCNVFG